MCTFQSTPPKDSARRCFPGRTAGPEMWAESHSWSLPPFKEKSHVRLFPAAGFKPQVILCSPQQHAGGGEGTTAAHTAVPPAWEGRRAAVLSAMRAASDLPPPCSGAEVGSHSGADVRSRQASTTGRHATHRLHVCAARPMCPPAMGWDVWQVTAMAAEAGTPHCSRHLLQSLVSTRKPVHTSQKAKGCSWSIQQLRHFTVYPDLQSEADQLRTELHNNPVAARLQLSHAHWQSPENLENPNNTLQGWTVNNRRCLTGNILLECAVYTVLKQILCW